jgi:hypothetical protein
VPAEPVALLHRRGRLAGQPLAALATAVAHDPCTSPRAHAAQEAVHTAAVAFLGLERTLDVVVSPSS